MTNLKDIPETKSDQTQNTAQSVHLHNGHNPNHQEPPLYLNPTKVKERTLQSRLLLGILPTVLVPLGIAGAIGVNIIRTNAEEEYQTRLEQQTLIAGEDMREWLSTYQAIGETLANNPLIIQAVREGSNQALNDGLNTRSTRQLEEQFQDTKLLRLNSALNNYFQQMSRTHNLSEIILTEQNGLNVAYNIITSDFVQKEEPWWEQGKAQGQFIGELEYDESSQAEVIPLMQSISDPDSKAFLGLMKLGIPATSLETVEKTLEHSGILPSGKIQILNTSNQQVLLSVGSQGTMLDTAVEGGQAVQAFAREMINTKTAELTVREENLGAIAKANGFSNLSLGEHDHDQHDDQAHEGEEDLIFQASFTYEGRQYQLGTIPQSDWITISSVSEQTLQAAGNELIGVFALVGAILALVATGIAFILANQLSSPLINVSSSAEKAAEGDLSVRAQAQGTIETKILANSFNNLVEQVERLLEDQKNNMEQQRSSREELEAEVFRLMSDIEQAAEGDLTVRAQLMEGDIGIVADLFNAVVENLQETAQQVKETATRVSDSLGENETEIREVAKGAIAEAEEIQTTLASIEAMNRSIQEVAQNAQKAAAIADTALNTAQEGNEAMDQTVQRIQELRLTVGETAKKMKQMGESAQKISQVVSLIDEISLKTSLLAINASVEANRAGELGQGFTAVAEQVEALAEQSASAAKDITQIVAGIQNETQEAIEIMEQGTSEVVASTRSVEQTKQRLGEVVERSEEINRLMRSISQATVSQAETSAVVSRLMEQVAKSSQNRSQTSKTTAQAIQETAQLAQSLRNSVDQFKVEK